MRLIIVEDDKILLQSLKVLLSGEPGIEIAGVYKTAEEALTALEEDTAAIEIMLVDLGLPEMSGVDLIMKARALRREMDILVHTISEERMSVFSAMKAGATGYILKGSTPRELVEAIFDLYKGGAPMSPKIARMVIKELHINGSREQDVLSKREKTILSNLEKGLTYKEIAGLLNISPHTVHTHIKNIYEKLHTKDRQEALRKAARMGIL
jgi:two-component system NarL family response regulator